VIMNCEYEKCVRKGHTLIAGGIHENYKDISIVRAPLEFDS
jgi:hypothetical protein